MSAPRAEVLLADSVAVSEGRLHVQGGGWNHLVPGALPAVAGRIGIGIVLRLPPERAGREVQVDLQLEGPGGDGVDLMTPDGARGLSGLSARVTPGELPAGVPEHVVPLAINLDGVILAATGAYRVSVAVDGVPSGEAAFAVLDE